MHGSSNNKSVGRSGTDEQPARILPAARALSEAKYLSIAQVSMRLNVSKRSVYRLTETNEIGFLKLGDRIVISEKDLAEFIDHNHVAPIWKDAIAYEDIS